MRSPLLLLLFLLPGCFLFGPGTPDQGAEIELKLPAGTTAEQSAATGKVLAERLEAAGWAWSEFQADSATKLRVRTGPVDAVQGAALKRLLTRPYEIAMYPVPPGTPPAQAEPLGKPIFTSKAVTNAYLKEVRGRWRNMLDLDSDHSKALQDATGELIGHNMALFVDGKILVAPAVKEAIRGGKLKIEPPGDDADAIHGNLFELAVAVRAGPLPVLPQLVGEGTWAAKAE